MDRQLQTVLAKIERRLAAIEKLLTADRSKKGTTSRSQSDPRRPAVKVRSYI